MRITETRTTRVIKASGAVTTTTSSTPFDVGSADQIAVLLDVTAVSGTTPSMTVTVQWSQDGTTWADADTPDTFTAITAVGAKVKNFTAKGMHARLRYTITGTTPSFTFSAHSIVGG